MATIKNQNTMIKRLKKQISALKRKEKATRIKLRNALLKVSKVARAGVKKLNKQTKKHKKKLAAVKDSEAKKYAKKLKKSLFTKECF